METTVSVKLPNLFEITKSLNAKFNPYYDDVKEDAKKWILNLARIYKNGKYVKCFESENVQKIAASMYPHSSKDGLRVAMDLTNLITIYDDISDHDADEAEKYGKIMKNVIETFPHDGEKYFGAEIKSFLFLVQRLCHSKNEFEIFLTKFLDFVSVIIEESKQRQNKTILDYEVFKKKRVISGGIDLMSYFGFITQNINLPQEILDEEIYQKFEENILDLQFVANDIYSFAKEFHTGTDDMNVVTILMKKNNLTLQKAFDEAGLLFEKHFNQAMECKKMLLNHFKNDDLRRRIEFLEYALAGNLEWSVQTKRYFKNGIDIKTNPVVMI